MTTASAIASWLGAMLPAGRPRRLSRMTGQASPKYHDLKHYPADWLTTHAAGSATYAATLDQNGRARLGVIDIDQGGRPALVATLAQLAAAGLQAWAVAVERPGGHAGGHIYVPYGAWCDAGAIRAQLQALAPDGAELWPSRQVIRLPFGVHRLAHTRGQLLTQAGELLDLDDAGELARALDLVGGLMNADPPPAPRLEPPSAPSCAAEFRPVARRQGGRLDARETIRAFNDAHPLDHLLSSYGAQPTRDGYTCPCGVDHEHTTTLYLSRKTGRLFSYSPRCKWHTDRGLDAFGLFCLVDHAGDTVAALKAVTAPCARPSSPTAAPALDPAVAARRRADADRKRAERAQAAAARVQQAAALRASVEARAAADATLTPSAQIVLQLLLSVARDRDWCRPSIAALCKLSAELRSNGRPYSERAVQQAIADLEEHQYITSDGDGRNNKTAIRRFLLPTSADCGVQNAQAAAAANCTHDHEEHVFSCSDSVEHVRGAQPPAPMPARERRAMVGDVRRLAQQLKEPNYYQRDPATLRDADLIAELARLQQACAERSDPPVASAELPSPAPATDAEPQPVHGPDGAIAYPDGAAWLPTPAALAWWEELQRQCTDPAPAQPTDQVDLVDLADPVELDRPPAPIGPILPPAARPLTAYRAQLASWSHAELRGELRRLQRTIAKHAGAFWLGKVRRQLQLVEEAIARADVYHGSPAARADRRARGPTRAPSHAQQLGFGGWDQSIATRSAAAAGVRR